MAQLGQARYCQDDDEQHIATLEIVDLAGRAPDLHKLYLRWYEAGDGEVPSTTAFDPALCAVVSGCTAELLDTTPEAPEDWPIYRCHGTEWISKQGNAFLRECLVRWARRCMVANTPIFQHVDETIAGEWSEYYRLLLPLRGPDAAGVERVFVTMVGDRIEVMLQ